MKSNKEFSEEALAHALAQPEGTRAFLVQLDSVFHQRVNILLVAESLFLAALSQVWASKEPGIILVICVIGFVMTLFLWGPLRVLAVRTSAVASLLGQDPLYQHYIRAISDPPKQTRRLANWLPGLFLGSWLVIMLLAMARRFGVLDLLF